MSWHNFRNGASLSVATTDAARSRRSLDASTDSLSRFPVERWWCCCFVGPYGCWDPLCRDRMCRDECGEVWRSGRCCTCSRVDIRIGSILVAICCIASVAQTITWGTLGSDIDDVESDCYCAVLVNATNSTQFCGGDKGALAPFGTPPGPRAARATIHALHDALSYQIAWSQWAFGFNPPEQMINRDAQAMLRPIIRRAGWGVSILSICMVGLRWVVHFTVPNECGSARQLWSHLMRLAAVVGWALAFIVVPWLTHCHIRRAITKHRETGQEKQPRTCMDLVAALAMLTFIVGTELRQVLLSNAVLLYGTIALCALGLVVLIADRNKTFTQWQSGYFTGILMLWRVMVPFVGEVMFSTLRLVGCAANQNEDFRDVVQLAVVVVFDCVFAGVKALTRRLADRGTVGLRAADSCILTFGIQCQHEIYYLLALTTFPPFGPSFITFLLLMVTRDIVLCTYLHMDLLYWMLRAPFNPARLARRVERQYAASELHLLAEAVAMVFMVCLVVAENLLAMAKFDGAHLLRDLPIRRVVTSNWCDSSVSSLFRPTGGGGGGGIKSITTSMPLVVHTLTCAVLLGAHTLKHYGVTKVMQWKLVRLHIATRAHQHRRAANVTVDNPLHRTSSEGSRACSSGVAVGGEMMASKRASITALDTVARSRVNELEPREGRTLSRQTTVNDLSRTWSLSTSQTARNYVGRHEVLVALTFVHAVLRVTMQIGLQRAEDIRNGVPVVMCASSTSRPSRNASCAVTYPRWA